MLKLTKQAFPAARGPQSSDRNHLPIGDHRYCATRLPEQANGGLIDRGSKAVASSLVGQPFSDPKYFWSRPSATTLSLADGSSTPMPYNAESSSGSNLGPTNPDLVKAVQERIAALRKADPGNEAPIPVDLVTSSASGLDPHISPAAAEYQVGRVARARGLTPQPCGD